MSRMFRVSMIVLFLGVAFFNLFMYVTRFNKPNAWWNVCCAVIAYFVAIYYAAKGE